MGTTPPSGRLLTQHTLFRSGWRSERGVRLQATPCNAFETQLRHPGDDLVSQRLGSALRDAGVGAFEFVSRPSGRRSDDDLHPVARSASRSISFSRSSSFWTWTCSVTSYCTPRK